MDDSSEAIEPSGMTKQELQRVLRKNKVKFKLHRDKDYYVGLVERKVLHRKKKVKADLDKTPVNKKRIPILKRGEKPVTIINHLASTDRVRPQKAMRENLGLISEDNEESVLVKKSHLDQERLKKIRLGQVEGKPKRKKRVDLQSHTEKEPAGIDDMSSKATSDQAPLFNSDYTSVLGDALGNAQSMEELLGQTGAAAGPQPPSPESFQGRGERRFEEIPAQVEPPHDRESARYEWAQEPPSSRGARTGDRMPPHDRESERYKWTQEPPSSRGARTGDWMPPHDRTPDDPDGDYFLKDGGLDFFDNLPTVLEPQKVPARFQIFAWIFVLFEFLLLPLLFRRP